MASRFTNPLTEPESLLLVNPERYGLVKSDHDISVRLIRRGKFAADLCAKGVRIHIDLAPIRVPFETFWIEFRDWLLDALISRLVCHDNASLILVRSSSPGFSWICSIRGESPDWQLSTVQVARSKIDTTYTIGNNPDQPALIRSSYQTFRNLVGTSLKLDELPSARVVRVKVAPTEHWFLRFPLGAFARAGFPDFADHPRVQWIVTRRSISQVAAAQHRVEHEMTATVRFLEGALIVLNTYRAHSAATDAPSISEGFNLLLQILGFFQNIPVRGKPLSLRWTLNPTPELLESLLLDPATRYVFADFEAEGGIWQTGDGKHRCSLPCHHQSGGSHDVNLADLEGKLRHIDLLNVFHCHSLYNPGDRLNPADEGTIAAALLDTGACFVDASSNLESVLVFLAMTIRTLLDRADLRMVLLTKELAGFMNFRELIARANSLIEAAGLMPVKAT